MGQSVPPLKNKITLVTELIVNKNNNSKMLILIFIGYVETISDRTTSGIYVNRNKWEEHKKECSTLLPFQNIIPIFIFIF